MSKINILSNFGEIMTIFKNLLWEKEYLLNLYANSKNLSTVIISIVPYSINSEKLKLIF